MISLHDQQAGEATWEADSRDRVIRDRKSFVDLQRGRGRWEREGDDIRRTSATMGLNRDKII